MFRSILIFLIFSCLNTIGSSQRVFTIDMLKEQQPYPPSVERIKITQKDIDKYHGIDSLLAQFRDYPRIISIHFKAVSFPSLPPSIFKFKKPVFSFWNNEKYIISELIFENSIRPKQVIKDLKGRELRALQFIDYPNIDIPVEIKDIKNLTELRFVLNTHTNAQKIEVPWNELVERIKSCGDLHILYLENYGLKNLPRNFRDINNLHVLSLRKNNFTSIDPSILPKTLVSIDFSFNKFAEIPIFSKKDFEDLQYLFFDCNTITAEALKKSKSALEKLELDYLDYSCNGLDLAALSDPMKGIALYYTGIKEYENDFKIAQIDCQECIRYKQQQHFESMMGTWQIEKAFYTETLDYEDLKNNNLEKIEWNFSKKQIHEIVLAQDGTSHKKTYNFQIQYDSSDESHFIIEVEDAQHQIKSELCIHSSRVEDNAYLEVLIKAGDPIFQVKEDYRILLSSKNLNQ